MTWVKLDDRIDENVKAAKLDNNAFALFVCGLAFCNRNLTDGFIPTIIGRGKLRYCENGTADPIKQLEEYKFWIPCEGGWMVHDYDQYQPSRSQVLAERQSTLSRVHKHRENGRNGVTHTVTNSSVTPFVHGNPESRVPNPESRIPEPESQNPETRASSTGEMRANDSAPPPICSAACRAHPTDETWEAYSAAYEARYGALPLRDNQSNSFLTRLMKAVGGINAPPIAAFYVRHNKHWYVTRHHSLKYLAEDAKELHTEWKTNRPVTSKEAQESDRLTGDIAMWERVAERNQRQANPHT